MAPWQSRPLGPQVARNRVRGFGLLKPHTVPARIVSPLSVAFSTLSAFQVESVEQPWDQSERGRCVGPKERRQARSPRTHAGGLRRGAAGTELPLAHGPGQSSTDGPSPADTWTASNR